ncbi:MULTISPECIES: hypothetical protein [Xanthomonas]|uniref:hypothetical protein n=1 Tax=Xanthomonas TaxID=338 RepID=UPI0020CC82B0|nr:MULTISPECIES: hypothetical protein [Xanthomonas]MEA9895069.1 hypothetical protein [Xanthomonas campestris pv. raphani]UTS73333.1 hypothetical protein NMB96_00195 [Xanthomonas hortorum]
MTNGKLWTKAFIAALGRVTAEEAKVEADKAVELFAQHLKDAKDKPVKSKLVRWRDQEMS